MERSTGALSGGTLARITTPRWASCHTAPSTPVRRPATTASWPCGTRHSHASAPRHRAAASPPAAPAAAETGAAAAGFGADRSAAAAAADGAVAPQRPNFHLVLHRVYKDPPEASPEMLARLEALTLERLDELNVDSLITVMYAFARSQPRYVPSRALVGRMAAATGAAMGGLSARQLEHAAASLAGVRWRPSPEWRRRFAAAMEAQWDGFRPPQLAATLLAAAALGLDALPRATLAEQLPAALRRAAAEGAGTPPGTMARLVWAAGHFGCAEASGPGRAAAAPEAAGPGAGAGVGAGAGAGPEVGLVKAVAAVAAADGGLRSEALLEWWDPPGAVEEVAPGDLVLLLQGLARLGVRPAPPWTQRVLAAVRPGLGWDLDLDPDQALDAHLLALLAWSTLKLAEAPPEGEWLGALVGALRTRLRAEAEAEREGQEQGQGQGRGWVQASKGAEGATAIEEEGSLGPAGSDPADVALALSSLAGLGAGALREGAQCWREGEGVGAARWVALSAADRAVMSLLGYGPEQGQGTVA